MGRSDRVRSFTGRIVVIVGTATYLWSIGVFAWQALHPTGTLGISTGYDGEVVYVEPGSPAAAAGVRLGDVVDFASAHALTGDLGRVAITPAHAPLPVGTVVRFTLRAPNAAHPRVLTLAAAPPTSVSYADLGTRVFFAVIMVGFCGVVLWTRSTPGAFASFAFALGANPFAYYVQFVPLPGVSSWCATVAIIDVLAAAAFGGIVLLALSFPPKPSDGSEWGRASDFRVWYLSAALGVAALSLCFQLGLDLPPILAGQRTGWLFPIDLGFDALVAAFGFVALGHRMRAAKENKDRARILRWTIIGYTLALGGLIVQVYLTYATPNDATAMLARRLSMSAFFMALVVGYSIVRSHGVARLIGRHIVRHAVTATAFMVIPPVEEHAAGMVRQMNAPPHAAEPEYTLATAVTLGIGYAGTALHHFIEAWQHGRDERERDEVEHRKRLEQCGVKLDACDRIAFVDRSASDPVEELELSAAAVFEPVADGTFARIAVAHGSVADMTAPLPPYFGEARCVVDTEHPLVRQFLAHAPHFEKRGALTGRPGSWALLAVPLRGGSDAALLGFALFARWSERRKAGFKKYESALLARYAEHVASGLSRFQRALPASALDVLEIDGTHHGLELLRSFRYRFATEAAAFDVEQDLRHRGADDGRRRVVLALVDGTPEGGAVFRVHADCGFVELLTVSERHRTTMLGRELVAYVERAARESVCARGRTFVAVFNAASDPFHPPAGADRTESFERTRWLAQLGFDHVALPYSEPGQRGATRTDTTMLLARSPSSSNTIASPSVAAAVRAHHLHAVPAQQPEADPAYRAMAAHAARHGDLRLESLETYAGQPDQALHFQQIDLRDEEQFAYFARLYSEIFPPSPSAFALDQIRHYVLEEFPRIRPRRVYRLLGFGGAPNAPDGFLSYFTLNGCGFAGYVGLRENIAHGNVLRRVVAYAERMMCLDDLGAEGWYTEVDEEPPRGKARHGGNARAARAAAFRRYGFSALDVPYDPPPLTPLSTVTKPTSLLYKPFGAVYGEPDLTPGALLAAVEEIDRVVYLVSDPLRDERYRKLAAAVKRRDRVPVRRVR